MNRRIRRAPLAALAVALAVPLAACGSSAESDTPDETTGSYAFSVDNCGTPVELDAVPQRIVAIKSTSIELVAALGAADRLVGTGFADGPAPEEWADGLADVEVLSEQAPSQEVVLGVEPDLVLAGWESNLAADTAGERETLAKLGVATYVSPAACQEKEYQPDPMTFDALFDQFAEAGDLLDEQDAAAELVDRQRAELAEVPTAVEGTTALWWSSGENTPFVGGAIGAPQMMLDAVGLTNVVTEHATWTSLGWEAIVDADPDVIVLVDATWNSAEQKIKALESNPATAALSAVKAKRYLTIPFPAAEAGVRSVPAAADLGAQLGELGLLGQE
ncbi:MAG: putative F420-0 ABC transporter substrate-binding protein [Nocardioides sp.]|uniref:putative F420-0 ABC transporter substrate-binding protein n=1 Tax=Nocardioides sp. TaxID=35761 RepID=UPI003F018769